MKTILGAGGAIGTVLVRVLLQAAQRVGGNNGVRLDLLTFLGSRD